MKAGALPNARPPALERLHTLYPLDEAASQALTSSTWRPRRVRARAEVLSEGQDVYEAWLLLDGWIARVRDLPDGRRQVLQLLLPGDLIGVCDHHRPLAASSIVAVTGAQLCEAPDQSISPTLQQAYAHSRAHEQVHLLAQITRLGRMTARERLIDFLLELHDRLSLAGLVSAGGRFTMPLTQEVVGDVLGLTSVHVNRTLQTLRKGGEVIWIGREVRLPDTDRLRTDVGRRPVRICARR